MEKDEVTSGEDSVLLPEDISRTLTIEATTDLGDLFDKFVTMGGYVLQKAVSRDSFILSTTRILLLARQMGLKKAIQEDYIQFKKDNLLDPSFTTSQYAQVNLQDLVRALEDSDGDPQRMEFVTKIFWAGAMGAAEKDVLKSSILLKIAVSLSVHEILIFKAVYGPNSVLGQNPPLDFIRLNLIEQLQQVAGIPFKKYADEAITGLSEKSILGSYSASNDRIQFNVNIRTEIGVALYEFFKFYENKTNKTEDK